MSALAKRRHAAIDVCQTVYRRGTHNLLCEFGVHVLYVRDVINGVGGRVKWDGRLGGVSYGDVDIDEMDWGWFADPGIWVAAYVWAGLSQLR